jgi:D-alanyl-D-alanine carboxypeptidase/D-alanyl-D-alanine-endopeptidase (penicillin-binding protein 4)
MQQVRRLLVAFVCCLLLAPLAEAAELQPLTARLAHALFSRSLSSADSGAIAVDLRTGGTLFERNPDTPLRPASNEKLPVSFAALRTLGGSYRFHTAVLGHGYLEGGVWHGDLYLKGYGDPTLTSRDLQRLAGQLARSGIRTVSGRLYADETWFDARRTAPGWKASFFINECSPISALVVDRAFYDQHVARVPALAAVGRFRQVLRRHLILTGAVGLHRAPVAALALADVQSAPLAKVIAFMDHESDNFTAEMLLKELGAEAGEGGTSAAGAVVVMRELQAAGLPVAGVRIADGSGLSLDDRLTARLITSLLTTAWNDPALRQELWRALPVAGVSGTLKHRLVSRPTLGAVRAKTGTTNRASALSGYVSERYAFSVLQNGVPVATWPARRAEDRFATALAREAAASR